MIPRCTLGGRWFSGGLTGVCPSVDHPLCRVPFLVADAPSVPSPRGWLRPERSLVPNDPTLLLHHAVSPAPHLPLDAIRLSGITKTATRIVSILRPYPWANPFPLDWPTPERLLLTTRNDRLLYDLVQLKDQLQQAERLLLTTLPTGHTHLTFIRCGP